CGDRLLHRRGLDPGRAGDVLRLVFPASEQSEGPCGWRHAASQCSMDDTGCVPPFTHGVFHWAVRLMMPTMIRDLHAVTLPPPSEAAADFPGAGGQVYSWQGCEAVCP